MKKNIIALSIVTLLAGCMHPQLRTVMWNLDYSSRVTEDYTPIIEIDIDAKGFPSAPKVVLDSFRARDIFRTHYLEWQEKHPEDPPDVMTDQEGKAILAEHGIDHTVPIQRIRWQIHPDAPLTRVAWLTSWLTGDESSEFWTSYGIFKVSAPAYGWRRLPTFSTDGTPTWSAEYRATQEGLFRDNILWNRATSSEDAVKHILADLHSHSHFNFVNIYFEFPPQTSWSDAETIMAAILPNVGGLRGMWIGNETNGPVTLHFHDIRKKAN